MAWCVLQDEEGWTLLDETGEGLEAELFSCARTCLLQDESGETLCDESGGALMAESCSGSHGGRMLRGLTGG